jgi:hypothetical protein
MGGTIRDTGEAVEGEKIDAKWSAGKQGGAHDCGGVALVNIGPDL